MALSLKDAKAMLQHVYMGDFRAIERLLRELIEGGLLVSSYVNVTDAATYTVSIEDSGKTFAIPNLTATCAITLPDVSIAGQDYTFVYTGAAADAQNFTITSTGATLFTGGVLHEAAAANTAVFAGAGGNVFTAVTPSAGTRVHVWSDGVKWYIEGQVVSASAPTFT